MQTIITKTLLPTDTKGTRVAAKCQAGRLVTAWDHALDPDANHRQAALALAEKLGWDYVIVSGGDGDNGYHIPIYDTMAQATPSYTPILPYTHTRKYRAAIVQGVLDDAQRDDTFVRMQLTVDGRSGAKTLSVGRKTLGALLAIFNSND